MKKLILLTIVMALSFSLSAQDTFSIIAVDTVTGEIGGAGASCIDENAIPTGVLIINDILPGRGGIHTQSYWHATNQNNAHNRMEEGMTPQEIIDWLVANDVQNNPGIRQYGIVDFDPNGGARSAAFTGDNCFDYKNHIIGPNYAIQGNILLGQEILDSMEVRFLNTEGSLAEKLMASLQGANVAGADTRCMNEGVSSLSAFLRVAQTGDTLGTYYCDLVVPSTPYGVEPIDSLQVLFDEWLNWVNIDTKDFSSDNLHVFPNPASSMVYLEYDNVEFPLALKCVIYDLRGQQVQINVLQESPAKVNIRDLERGLYIIKVYDGNQLLHTSKLTVGK